MKQRVIITGAFSYAGSRVAQELVKRGYSVHTLTNRGMAEGTLKEITASPLQFQFDVLVSEMKTADIFINTYWIRIPYGGHTFATAVDNSRMLFEAAKKAGIKRIVHVSVSNANQGKNLGYYSGKAQVEEILRGIGLPYAIVCPTLIVGSGDVLTNNIAWFLRHTPVFFIPNGGKYCLQPITIDDTARIICDMVAEPGNREIDAAGPEIFTFADYIRLLMRACKVHKWLLSTPGWISLSSLYFFELFLRDIILTREELLGLQQELLVSLSAPLGQQSVSTWLKVHGHKLGNNYTNDLDRHFRSKRIEPITSPKD